MSPTGRDLGWIAAEFDRRAARYDDSTMHQLQARHAAQLLAPQPGQQILDLATGTGLALRACAALTGTSDTLTGVDISQQMLRTATAHATGRYLRADAARLPFRAATFDALLCVSAIPYLPDFTDALTEWRRVGRRNAALVFTTPATDEITGLRLLRHAALERGIDVPDPHRRLGTAEAVTRHLDRLGVTVEHIETQTFPEHLGPDARVAFDTLIAYGFAEPLRLASAATRDQVFPAFQADYHHGRAAGTAKHVVLFTRCRLTDHQ